MTAKSAIGPKGLIIILFIVFVCVQWFVTIGAFKSFYPNARKAYCRSTKMKGLLFGVIIFMSR